MAASSSEQEQRAVRQRDAVAHAESQLARERRSREELEQMLAEQSRQDSEQRMAVRTLQSIPNLIRCNSI